MSDRITFRSRDRLESFFPSPATSTVAAMSGNGYVGPFTESQMMELWFRVKAIRVRATVAWSEDRDPDPPETGTSTIDVTLVRSYVGFYNAAGDYDDEGITDERELANEWQADMGCEFKTNSIVDDFGLGTARLNRKQLVRDENGDLWFAATGFSALLTRASNDGKTVLRYDGTIPAADPQIHVFTGAVLTFSDASTVPFPFAAELLTYPSEITSASGGSVEFTEWFPYKTTAGVAAYNTTTGAPINGGPAA